MDQNKNYTIFMNKAVYSPNSSEPTIYASVTPSIVESIGVRLSYIAIEYCYFRTRFSTTQYVGNNGRQFVIGTMRRQK